MSEIRQNMATKEWVIIATERARRPEEFADWSQRPKMADLPPWDADCPFCPGNEEGPEMEVLRLPESGPWKLRVVKNKFPALRWEGDRQRSFDGVHRWISGVGYHEVLVETPKHNLPCAEAPVTEIQRTFRAFQLRGLSMAQDRRVEHVIYFKNHGPRAGTSLVHPHCQIIGLPVVPYRVRSRVEEARRYFDDTGECVYCAMVTDELSERERVIYENGSFVVFLPYAAFSPFHTWVMPRQHESSFLNVSEVVLHDLADCMRALMRKLYVGLNDPDFNVVLRTSPVREWHLDYLHWYVTVVPRVTQSAGFELGSGMFINTALPEESAAFLRTART